MREIIDLNKNEVENIIGLTSNIYGFLARGYLKEVDEDYFKKIKNILPVFQHLESCSGDENLSIGVRKLESYFVGIADIQKEIEKQSTMFTTLFLNVSPDDSIKHIHPFESVYLSPDRLVMQDQRDEVEEFYSRYGLGVIDGFREPEDHIAAELSFLSKLNELILADLVNDNHEATLNKLKGQQEFMEQHLLKWVHIMCAELKEACGEGFYNILAELTIGYIRTNYKFMLSFIDYLNEFKF